MRAKKYYHGLVGSLILALAVLCEWSKFGTICTFLACLAALHIYTEMERRDDREDGDQT